MENFMVSFIWWYFNESNFLGNSVESLEIAKSMANSSIGLQRKVRPQRAFF